MKDEFPRTHKKICAGCGAPFKCKFKKQSPFNCARGYSPKTECSCPACIMKNYPERGRDALNFCFGIRKNSVEYRFLKILAGEYKGAF